MSKLFNRKYLKFERIDELGLFDYLKSIDNTNDSFFAKRAGRVLHGLNPRKFDEVHAVTFPFHKSGFYDSTRKGPNVKNSKGFCMRANLLEINLAILQSDSLIGMIANNTYQGETLFEYGLLLEEKKQASFYDLNLEHSQVYLQSLNLRLSRESELIEEQESYFRRKDESISRDDFLEITHPLHSLLYLLERHQRKTRLI